MGSLYSKAHLVFSWLGPEYEDCGYALDMLEQMARAILSAEDPSSFNGFSSFQSVYELMKMLETRGSIRIKCGLLATNCSNDLIGVDFGSFRKWCLLDGAS
jgi:hypothetical protein